MESLHKILLAVKSLEYIGFKKFKRTFKLTKKQKEVAYTFEDFETTNRFLLDNCFY